MSSGFLRLCCSRPSQLLQHSIVDTLVMGTLKQFSNHVNTAPDSGISFEPKTKRGWNVFFLVRQFWVGPKKSNCKYDVYFSHVGEIARICCQRHTRSYKNGHVATLHVWLHFLCQGSFHMNMKKFNPCFTIPSGTIASIKGAMKPCHSMVMVRKPDIRAQQFLKLQFLVWSITGWRLSRFGESTYMRQSLLQLLTGWNERFCSKHSMSGHVSIIFQFRKSYDVWASRDVMKNSMYSLPTTTPQNGRTNTYQNRKRNQKIIVMRFWSGTHQHTLQITKPIQMFKASAWLSIIITLHLNPNAHLFTQFYHFYKRCWANTLNQLLIYLIWTDMQTPGSIVTTAAHTCKTFQSCGSSVACCSGSGSGMPWHTTPGFQAKAYDASDEAKANWRVVARWPHEEKGDGYDASVEAKAQGTRSLNDKPQRKVSYNCQRVAEGGAVWSSPKKENM